jgi:hypothetical protein
MGNQGVDVQLSQQALQLFPYCVECKSRRAIAVYRDFQQAMDNSKDGLPLLVIKQNGSKPLAVVDLDHFLELTSGHQTNNRD